MGYLRLASAAAPTLESACLEAFDRELDYLFETIRRLGARPSETEDLVQEVFVVLDRKWPTFDTTRSLRPYLFGVAFRIVCAHRRRYAREVPHPGLDVEDGGAVPNSCYRARNRRLS